MVRLNGDNKDYLDDNDSWEIPVILWDTLKPVIRGRIICITTYMEKSKH